MYEISHMLGNKRGSVLLKFHFPTPLLPPLSPLFTLPSAARLEESRRGDPGAAGAQLPARTSGSRHGRGNVGLTPPGSAGAHGEQRALLPHGRKGKGKEVSMASTSNPGLTGVALGTVAIPAGCWSGTALRAHRHEHWQTPGWRGLPAEVGFPETPGMFFP